MHMKKVADSSDSSLSSSGQLNDLDIVAFNGGRSTPAFHLTSPE